jgi:hypothetical protein
MKAFLNIGGNMYIKPSTPILRSDSGLSPKKFIKKTDSGSEVFKDILEDIDIVELSPELDPDEKRQGGDRASEEESKEHPPQQIIYIHGASKGVNRFA